jgi:serine/threonine-protein kinase
MSETKTDAEEASEASDPEATMATVVSGKGQETARAVREARAKRASETAEEPGTVATAVLSEHEKLGPGAPDKEKVSTPPPPTGNTTGQPSTTVAELMTGATQISVTTPKQAMQADEERRMRLFIWFAGALGLVSCAVTPLMPGDAVATWPFVAAAALTLFSALAVQFLMYRGKPYQSWMGVLIGMCAATAVNTGYYFYGVNSAIVMVIPIGTFFYALGEDFRFAIFVHFYITLGHAVISALQIFGVLPDVGLVRTAEGSMFQQLGMLVGLQTVFFATFWMARALRTAQHNTLEHLDKAVRDIAQREALLNEAKEELARAKHVGGPGRFSEQVLGNFKLGHVLGRGGMGEVYEAVHTDTGELAAVKLLLREAMAKPDMVARFMREVDIASTLQVDNVVKVLEIPDAEAPIPYLAMERLVGETLSAKLRKKARPKLEEASTMVREVAAGIGAAHEAGIVHRDLKPQNIFCHRKEGQKVWKILDFGVSKLMDQSGTLTKDQMVGTPTYMAPEQARGREVDARADLYSLGIISYRVLTGRPAFSGRDLPSILMAVTYDMPPQPSEIAPVDPAFDLVLAIACAKDPDDRFDTAQEFLGAFSQALQGKLSRRLVERGNRLVERHPWGGRSAED